MSKKRVGASLPRDVYAVLKIEAEKQDLTVAALIAAIITEWLFTNSNEWDDRE